MKHSIKGIVAFITVVMLALSTSGFAEMDSSMPVVMSPEEEFAIGDFAEYLLDGSTPDENTLFYCLLDQAWDCNDWDTLAALQRWKSYSSVELTGYNLNNSNVDIDDEKYYFRVVVQDAIVDFAFSISFNLYAENSGGEIRECEIEKVSTKTNLSQMTWVTSESNKYYYESDARPDGSLAVTGHFRSGDEWVTKYAYVSLYPVGDVSKGYPYGYSVAFNNAWEIILYPDGTLYDLWYRVYCYPEGMEQQVNAIEASYGNTIGNTSSNHFNGCQMAMEGDVLITYSKGTVYRQQKDGNNKMGIYNNSNSSGFSYFNLLDGECWFVRKSEGAYGVTLDGRLDFLQQANVGGMVVDKDGAYYTVYYDDYNLDKGVYLFDTGAGTNRLIYSAEAEHIGVYGNWIYFTTLEGSYIYRVRKAGGEREKASESKIIGGPFIVQDGVIIYYADNGNLCYRQIDENDRLGQEVAIADWTNFGGRSAYIGSDRTKRVAFDHGWLYYYYSKDNSMICRRSLDGSVVDEFVCYSAGFTNGIYFFGNEMYLGKDDGEVRLATELDNSFAPGFDYNLTKETPVEEVAYTADDFFSSLDRMTLNESLSFIQKCAENHENFWEMTNDAYQTLGKDIEAIFSRYGVEVKTEDSFYALMTYSSDDVYKCIYVVAQMNDAETAESIAAENMSQNGQPDSDGWCTDTYACGRSVVTLMYRYSALMESDSSAIEESIDLEDETIHQDLSDDTAIDNASVSDGFEYTIMDSGSVQITTFRYNTETIYVPTELDGLRVTSIGDRAFFYCYDLTEITIPDSVTDVGINPFAGCKILQRIIISPDHSALETIDGVLFSKTDRRLICYPSALEYKEYTIPQGVEYIGDWAFSCSFNPTCLTDVTISDSVISIGEGAFSGCSYLTNVTIPSSVTSIGEYAFSGCQDLLITVEHDSYAAAYCKENGLNYIYPDSRDWLNG